MPVIHGRPEFLGKVARGETWNTTQTTDNYNYGASG